MGDQEAFQFATSLKSTLETAGWRVNGVNQSMFSVPVHGVVISVKCEPPPEARMRSSLRSSEQAFLRQGTSLRNSKRGVWRCGSVPNN